jgi:hypothetical protein
VVARGGRGGRGNTSFATKKQRAPKRATTGALGQRFRLELELKTVADVGLIGYPNAGKSSLLARLSTAKPKVASYAFTTLRPYVGVVDIEDPCAEPFTVADLPGLVRGAHMNIGLGHSFLRHVERTKVLPPSLSLSPPPLSSIALSPSHSLLSPLSSLLSPLSSLLSPLSSLLSRPLVALGVSLLLDCRVRTLSFRSAFVRVSVCVCVCVCEGRPL